MMSDRDTEREFSSFRDPSGHIFRKNGVLYRQINRCYAKQYEALMSTGLYDALTQQELLIPHADSEALPTGDADAYRIIRPQPVPVISYPYEWCFGQLKDAALTTLRIHRQALDHGLILKDASAYNIQFIHGRAKLIDTLSFDFYTEGMPWAAYGQFVRHFLAPLELMAHVDLSMNTLLRSYIDGVPPEIASSILGKRGGLFARQHIHWHALSIQKHGQDGRQPASVTRVTVSKYMHISLIDSLIRGIERLSLDAKKTEWGEYYRQTNYSAAAFEGKAHAVRDCLERTRPAYVWDMGANDGRFSRIAADVGAEVTALDIDPVAVGKNYQTVKAQAETILPLVFDFTNPSPCIGFSNRERMSLEARRKPDCILALAIIHHMAISNNLPFDYIAKWFSSLCKTLVIEFVPKSDSQVAILLATRDDIFGNYSQEGFETAFSRYFEIAERISIDGSDRIVYRMLNQSADKAHTLSK